LQIGRRESRDIRNTALIWRRDFVFSCLDAKKGIENLGNKQKKGITETNAAINNDERKQPKSRKML
jgi:hypothetical protein